MKRMKRLKRFLAVVMTMIMVLSMSGISVIASTTSSTTDASGNTTTTVTYETTEQTTNGGIISKATTVDSSGYTTKEVTTYNDATMVTVEYEYDSGTVVKTTTTTQTYTDTTFETLKTQTIVTVDESTSGTTITTTKEYTVNTGTPTLSSTTTVTVVTDASAGTVTTTTEVTDGSGDFDSKTVEVVDTSTENKVVTTTTTYSDESTVSKTVVKTVTYEYNGTTLERTTTVTETYNGTVSDVNLTSTVTEISGVKDSTNATYTLTIDNDVSGYEYTAYQVFKGDLYDVYTSVNDLTASTYTGQLYTYDSATNTFSKATYTDSSTTYYTKTSTLSNIEWGDDMDTITTINNLTLIEAIQAITTSGSDTPFSAATTAAEVAAILAKCNDDDEVLQLFAEVIADYLKANSRTTSTDCADTYSYYTISGLAPGYYFVSSTTVPANASASRYMLTVVSNQEIESKTDKSTVEKEVDLVSASIGDTVTYTLTATLPSNYADYSAYTLIFHDTLSDGLTYTENSVVVKVYNYVEASGLAEFIQGTTYYTLSNGVYTEVDTTNTTTPENGVTYYTLEGTEVDSGYYVNTPGYTKVSITSSEFDSNSSGMYYTYDSTTGKYENASTSYDSDTQYYVVDGTLEIRIDNTNNLEDNTSNQITVTSSSLIVVTYKATVNSNAVIGNGTNTSAYGNTNAVTLEYSNNPNSGGEGLTGTTTTQLVTTFTFELDVTKTDTDSNTLEGAEFLLYKYVDVSGTQTKYYAILDSDSKINEWTTDSSKATTITSDSSGNFSIIGLREGAYYLEETKAPAGYNLLSSAIEIVIRATYTDTDGDGEEDEIETLTATVNTSDSWTTNITTGSISGSIKNSAGSTIPTTGGMGTTILYIIGAILVISAAVILVTRRRMANK